MTFSNKIEFSLFHYFTDFKRIRENDLNYKKKNIYFNVTTGHDAKNYD